MPDKFLFEVTKESSIFTNAHLGKGDVLNDFLKYQYEKTKKIWSFTDDGSKVVVFPKDHSRLPREFRYIAAESKSSIERFPKGTFYAIHSEDEDEKRITIEYYEKC